MSPPKLSLALCFVMATVTQAAAQAKPALTFSTLDGGGPGIYSPVSVQADPGRIVVSGRLILGENCRRLSGALTVANTHTLILALSNSRVGDIFCGRDETPVRYRAEIGPLAPGSYKVRITYRNLGGTPVVLANIAVAVPPND
jgi:hypothetical protein